MDFFGIFRKIRIFSELFGYFPNFSETFQILTAEYTVFLNFPETEKSVVYPKNFEYSFFNIAEKSSTVLYQTVLYGTILSVAFLIEWKPR